MFESREQTSGDRPSVSKRWALTGTTGFIGRTLAAAAMGRGLDVCGLTRGKSVLPGVEAVPGDLSNQAALAQLVRRADVVVHLAAYVHHGGSGERERRACRAVNVDGTARVVEAVAAEASRSWLVFVSSASVYAPSEAPIDEAARCAPTTVYGETKLEAERIVLDAARSGAIRACVLRPATVFGPGAPGNLQRLIRMVGSGFVIEFRHGEQRKTIVPVRNVVSACFAVQQSAPSGEIFNVGGAMVTIRHLTNVIAAVLGKRPIHIQMPRGVFLQGGHVIDRLLHTSWSHLVRVYSSNAIILDDKLRRLSLYEPAGDVDADLRAMIRHE